MYVPEFVLPTEGRFIEPKYILLQNDIVFVYF